MLILNVEARRKDHVQMMTHHIVTVALMAASYFMNFTRSGALIMVLMDWCDIFLPVRHPPLDFLDTHNCLVDSWQRCWDISKPQK
jgi:hypothetical protein